MYIHTTPVGTVCQYCGDAIIKNYYWKIKTTRKTRGLKGPSRACCQQRLKTHEEFANRTSFTGRR